MKKTYQTPTADLTVFRPSEALADILWDDLLQNQYGDNTDRNPAEKLSGDISITL